MQAPLIWLRAVSKGLNTLDLTFDPGVSEKFKSKVRPKKNTPWLDVAHCVCIQRFLSPTSACMRRSYDTPTFKQSGSPHTYQYYEKKRVPMYVCIYVCMFVRAIRCPRAHHACALACTRHKVQTGKDHQRTCHDSKYSSPKLWQESWATAN